MADNADRKALFPNDRNDRDEATAHDPLMELSLIAGFDDAPREEHGDAPPEEAPDVADAPVARDAESSTQIDLEEALEAELSPTIPAAEPADEKDAVDEAASGQEEPLDIRAYLSAGDSGTPERPSDAAPALEAELDLPAAAPSSSAWQPAEQDRQTGFPATELAEPRLGGLPDDDAGPAQPTPMQTAAVPAAQAAGDDDQPGDPVFGRTGAPTEAAVKAPEEPAASAPVSGPSLEDELAALLSGSGDAAAPATPAPVSAHADAMAAAQDDIDPGSDDTADDAAPAEPAYAPTPAPEETLPAAEALADDWSDIEAAWSEGSDQAWEAPDAGQTQGEPTGTAEAETMHDAVPDDDGPVFSRATPVAPDFVAPMAAQGESPQPASVAEPEAAAPEVDLETDFFAAFDAELAEGTPAIADGDWADRTLPEQSDAAPRAADAAAGPSQLDPVDELAAIMGLERRPEPAEPYATPGAQASSIDDMEAEFESALDQELTGFDEPGTPAPPSAGVASQAAPVLDTVDMSGFDGVGAADFDVPEFEPPSEAALDEGAFTGLEDELASAFDADTRERPAANATPDPVAADLYDDGAFDAAGFEAELARDMEFVGHDLDTARQPEDRDDGHGAPAEAAQDRQSGGSSRRAMIIGAVVAGLAVLGIGGVLALSGGDGAVDDGPVLVEADAEPVKIEPDDPGGTTVPNQDRAVFASGSDAEPEQENLVTTAEEPVDIASAPADGLPSAVAAGGAKSEDRLTEGGTESATQDAIAPITPRRVRTLVVRPDGTLEERAPEPEPAQATQTLAAATEAVSNADASAAVEPAAPIVGEPATVGGLPVDAGDATAAATAPAATTQDTDTAAAAPTNATPEAADASAETAPVVVRRVQTTTATPAAIADRPADQPVNVVNRSQQVASAPAAPTPAPTPTVTNGSTGGFTVQLAALPSEAAARTTATRLSQQYGSLIAGRGMTIQRAVIEGRGTFYRIRVAADGSGDANNLCNRIKASGGNCFVAR